MKFIFAGYVFTREFNQPELWLNRIKMYNGILESLSKNNEVVSIQQIDYEGEHVKDGVKHYFKKFSKAGRYVPGKLHYFIKKQKPDVVVVQGLHQPLQVIQLRMALGSKTGIILHHHGERPFNGLKKYLQLWASRHVDGYLFASHDIGKEWVANGNISDRKRIYEVMEVSSAFYPIDKTTAKQKTGADTQTVFLWVGRLNENKDPLCVVSAFLQYADMNKEVKLYMIYQTEELLPAIKRLLAGHPNKDAVVLIGQVPNDDLLYWYNSADFIVSGSHYEGSGTAVAEAMSCGCIPILTNIPSFKMITDNGQCGILYEAGNEAALIAALKQTGQMNTAAKSKKCLSYFKAKLSFDAIAREFETIAAGL
jgi:glycosyltransferase involved in cell wall biosynthesis